MWGIYILNRIYFQGNKLHTHLSHCAKLNKIHLTYCILSLHPFRVLKCSILKGQVSLWRNPGHSALLLLWHSIRILEGPGPDSDDEMTFTTEQTHLAPAAHLRSVGQILYAPLCLTDREANVLMSVSSRSPLSPNKSEWKCFTKSQICSTFSPSLSPVTWLSVVKAAFRTKLCGTREEIHQPPSQNHNRWRCSFACYLLCKNRIKHVMKL